MTNPTQALDAIEQALTDGKKLLVAIKNSNDLDGRIAFLPQKTEETIQNVFEALAHIATLKQQVAELEKVFKAGQALSKKAFVMTKPVYAVHFRDCVNEERELYEAVVAISGKTKIKGEGESNA